MWSEGYVERIDPLKPLRAPRQTIRLYHLTSDYLVAKIVTSGFTDRGPEAGDDKESPESVTLTDVPMTRESYGEAILTVDLPEAVVLPYEWITVTRSHRRFAVPSEVVNGHGAVGRWQRESA